LRRTGAGLVGVRSGPLKFYRIRLSAPSSEPIRITTRRDGSLPVFRPRLPTLAPSGPS